ncbi:hypothetical protein ES703_63914 [subsurface metagenome]
MSEVREFGDRFPIANSETDGGGRVHDLPLFNETDMNPPVG